jgi:hypothetical protein
MLANTHIAIALKDVAKNHRIAFGISKISRLIVEIKLLPDFDRDI